MNTLKNLILITLIAGAAQYSQAQSGAIKETVSFKLKNGMNIIIAENREVSKVYSSLTFDAETGIKPGLQYVLNAMLNETVNKINKEVSFDEKGGNVASLTADFDKALFVMSASVKEPVFDQASFEKIKANLIASVVARDRYYPASFTKAALDDLTLADVSEFHKEHLTPSRTYLTIVGDINTNTAKSLAKRAFGDWDETPAYTERADVLVNNSL